MWRRFLLPARTSPSISNPHMLLLKAPLRFMLLSAHKGAIRNKDPIKPSDVSTGTTASGYCSRQMKRSTSCMFVSYSKSKVVNFELCCTAHTRTNTMKLCNMTSTQDRWHVFLLSPATAQCYRSIQGTHRSKTSKELRDYLFFIFYFFKKAHYWIHFLRVICTIFARNICIAFHLARART